jgi:NhaA family Na+:H+ antiporter
MVKEKLKENKILKKLIPPMQKFIKLETSGGLVLLISTIIALVFANSLLSTFYNDLVNYKIRICDYEPLNKSVAVWVNDGLMVIFFFVVSLEIKREVLFGELKSFKKTILPIFAAAGGMAAPLIFYLIFNHSGKEALGWGIPVATDIAFSIGVLKILGKRVPNALKIFLTALAIIDDIGAVIVIAIFYTADIALINLAAAGVLLIALAVLNKRGVVNFYAYLPLGILLWLAFLSSGVHPTIAGVLFAFTIPADSSFDKSLLHKLENKFHTFSVFVIMPVFAFINAGVPLAGDFLHSLVNPISLGIITGLVLGKPAGIFSASFIAVKSGLASLPKGIKWKHVFGLGWVAGIGFTMSLFISNLAFGKVPLFINEAKAGILAASCIAGIAGYFILRFICSHKKGE